jgi:hypothetical protein
MARHMTTTVRLNDGLLEQAKAEAKKRGETLTSLIEQGLRLVLAQSKGEAPRPRVELPISTHAGVAPGVDISNSAELEDLMWDGKLR